MKERILPVDGLRTLSALGVIWIHTWAFFGNPVLKIASVDLYQMAAIAGNGVDFFFVISGFCMYLMIGNKEYDLKGYAQFLYKRFLRIAPTFYVAVLVYALVKEYYEPSFAFVLQAIFHFLFLNNITGNTISGPFWSIATEWHFYIVLPFVIILIKRISLAKALAIVSLCSLILFAFVNKGYLEFGFWTNQIFVRFPEFAVGIYAAYFLKKNGSLPGFFKGAKGLCFAFAIMYAGRFLKFTSFLKFTGSAGFLFKTIADTVMVSGFGIILLHLIIFPSAFSRFLSTKGMTWLGRISYSIYLWHSLSILMLAHILNKLPFGPLNVITGFILISLLTVIISFFSYKYLEAFYFKSCQKGNRFRFNERITTTDIDVQPSSKS